MPEQGEQLPFRLQFDHQPVDANHRLVPSSTERAMHLEEYYDMQLGSRVISIPKGSEEARHHEELLEERLPVFSALYTPDRLLLLVPEGSSTLQKTLPLMARDLGSYSEIFHNLGSTLGKLDTTSFGLPEAYIGRSILASFAFSLDENETFGGKIYLIPPYSLDPMRQKHRDQEVDAIYEELLRSRYLSEGAAQLLVEIMVEGWQEELYRHHLES